MITVSDLSKTYKRGRSKVQALKQVSFTVEEGEVFAFIGPNGAGKTTLMECLLGLIWPTTGTILINGHSPTHLEVRRITGFLPERAKYDKWMSPREFVGYHYLLGGGDWNKRKVAVEGALDRVGLIQAARSRPVKTFSKGMLQKVGLAQMLVHTPRVCFLDEPTSGLDPPGRNMVRDLIRQWKQEKVTVVLNSHNLDDVERVCDRVAFVNAGTIDIVDQRESAEQTVTVMVRWIGPEDTEKRLKEIASQFDVMLYLPDREETAALPESDGGFCRFVLRARHQMPGLVRSLINAQIDLEEVFFERKNLSDLFANIKENENTTDD